MKHLLFRAFLLSLLLFIAQQICGVIFSWHMFSLAEAPLVILVFMIILGMEPRLILITSCFTGLLLDVWSPSEFGTIALALTLTSFVSLHIFHRALTNKSLSALLILGVVSTFTYRLLIFLIGLINFLKNPDSIWRALADSILRGGGQAIIHSLILLTFFFINRLISRRLHPHYVRSS